MGEVKVVCREIQEYIDAFPNIVIKAGPDDLVSNLYREIGGGLNVFDENYEPVGSEFEGGRYHMMRYDPTKTYIIQNDGDEYRLYFETKRTPFMDRVFIRERRAFLDKVDPESFDPEGNEMKLDMSIIVIERTVSHNEVGWEGYPPPEVIHYRENRLFVMAKPFEDSDLLMYRMAMQLLASNYSEKK